MPPTSSVITRKRRGPQRLNDRIVLKVLTSLICLVYFLTLFYVWYRHLNQIELPSDNVEPPEVFEVFRSTAPKGKSVGRKNKRKPMNQLTLTTLEGTAKAASDESKISIGSENNAGTASGKIKIKKRRKEVIDKESSTETKQRPKFILHIGPIKTGTTTIQCTLPQYYNTLQRDSYIFIGKVGKRCKDPIKGKYLPSAGMLKILRCLLNNQTSTDGDGGGGCPAWNALTDRLEKHYRQSDNLIFSAEEFDHYDLLNNPHLLIPLRQLLNDWDVTIVIAYRRYHEWIVSAYNEANKPTDKDRLYSKWPAKQKSRDPSLIPSFQSFYSQRLGSPFHGPLFQNPVRRLKTVYSQAFPPTAANILVMNIHAADNKDLLTTFFCHVVPGLNHTCHARRLTTSSRSAKEERVNQSIELHHDVLAVAAWRMGLVEKGLTRVMVRNATRVYTEQRGLFLGSDLALRCPADEGYKLRLLEKSLEIEREVVPEWLGLEGVEEEHRKSFDVAWRRGKFCMVDTAKVLEDEEWRKFYRSLESPFSGMEK